MFGAPPKLPAPKLFRLLLRRPRPAWPIDFRFRCWPRAALCVRGLRGLEVESAIDAVDDSREVEEKLRAMAPRIIALALTFEDGALAFDRPGALDALDEDEHEELSSQVYEALSVISPIYHRCDVAAWETRLDIGAGHVSNMREAVLAGRCQDDSGERPDRYFGMPSSELTDGQLMAFRAGIDLVNQLRRKKLA